MKVAVIGSGFTGLGAALGLLFKGHKITVIEATSLPGGLAGGFKDHNWSWSLEHHYHHLFGTDSLALELGRRVSCPINFYSVNSSTLYKHKFHRFDNPVALLSFPLLSFTDKLRTGAVLAFFKIWPFWHIFEGVTSDFLLNKLMGKKAFDILWRPFFEKKFHSFWSQISAVWFWARIKFRTQALAYPEGGFLQLAEKTVTYLKNNGVKFEFNSPVTSLKKTSDGFQVTTANGAQVFDRVISTLPVSVTQKIARFYSCSSQMNHLGAVNLVLELKNPLLPNGIYWLNINDSDLPFLAVVEHTNFIDSGHYGQKPLVYVGNYLPAGHQYFSLTADQLLQKYLPGLKKINPDFSTDWVSKSWIFKAAYAQSIVTVNFKDQLPPMVTSTPGFFVANIQQVYPHDRGINYSLKLGYRVASLVNNSEMQYES